MTKKWTENEINVLLQYYGQINIKQIHNQYLTTRSESSIQHKAQRLKLHGYSSKQDMSGQIINGIKFIQEYGKTSSNNTLWLCQCFCGKNFTTIPSRIKSGHARSCGCDHKTKWKKQEIDILKLSYGCCRKEELLSLLPNRTWDAIKIQAIKLGLRYYSINNVPAHGNMSKLLEDNDIAYYWIGFLLADGCIYDDRLTVALSIKDVHHLICLSQFLECQYRIAHNKPVCYIHIKDIFHVKLIQEKFDWKKAKTYNPPDLSRLDNHILTPLFIGFIDGDGHIFKQYGHRKDFVISIHIHASWLSVMTLFHKHLQATMNINIAKPKIRKDGYLTWNIANHLIIDYLNYYRQQHKLPVLNRKWNQILETEGIS